jgi:hypothetical protein
MTYHAPELVLIGAAQNLVQGPPIARVAPDNSTGLFTSRNTPTL